MTDPDVREVHPADDDLLAAWHAVERASVRSFDRATPHRSLAALTSSVQHRSDYGARLLLAAYDGARIVGVAELAWPLTEDLHRCSAEIHVLPAVRRRGVGRALWVEVDRRRQIVGRSVVEAEIDVPAAQLTGGSGGTGGTGAPGPAFAAALGFRTVHTEDHFTLPLPVAGGRLDRIAAAAEAAATDYEVLTWWGRCPDEHVEAYCAMQTRMNADVPTGESDRAAVVMTVDRLRVSEQRLARSYETLVSAVRRTVDGEMAGYSLVFCDREDDEVIQDDTLVMPGHRGRRLGTLLKLANLRAIELLDAPRRVVHTWTAPTNAPMLAVNRAFGFVLASRSLEVQRRDG